MRKNYLLLFLLLFCSIGIRAQQIRMRASSEVKTVNQLKSRATRASDQQGVTATLKYERVADTPSNPGPDNQDPGPDLSNSKANLVVVTKSGEHEFRLAEKPEVFFTGTKLRVASPESTVDFEISDVIRFIYKNVSPTGINDLTVDDDPTVVNYQEDGVLVISQFKEGGAVSIYAMDGKLIRKLKATHKGTYRISLSSLPKGVYIVKADTITYKIMKR